MLRHDRGPVSPNRLARRLLPIACGIGLACVGGEALAREKRERKPVAEFKFGRDHKGIGIGLSAGDPMGASIKWFVRIQHALSFHVAWGLLHHGDGLVTVDYHWHTRPIGYSEIVDAHFYIGGGLGLAFWARPGPPRIQIHARPSPSGAALLLRAPALGLAYHWKEVPLDTSLELAWSPYVVLPDLLHLDASIKVRYFF
jgi:hypothetical protein